MPPYTQQFPVFIWGDYLETRAESEHFYRHSEPVATNIQGSQEPRDMLKQLKTL